jgi:ABC-type lipoprotein release transport system permease subunit
MALALLFTIALGIGSQVTIQALVRGLTQPNSAFAPADRIVSVFVRDPHRDAGPLSYQEYLALRGHPDAFEWIGAARQRPSAVELAGQSEIVSIAAVTANLARELNLPLKSGVVVSQRWGQSNQIRLDGVNARVRGIAPKSLEGIYRDRPVDLWMSLPEGALAASDRTRRMLWVVGRLRRDVSIAQAQAIVQRGRAGSGEVQILPYTGLTPDAADSFARVATLLGFAAGAVFFIACCNVASFLFGRAFARSHEISLRVALGAGRSQLARELLSDSVVISLVGGVAGLLLAGWTSNIIPALLFEQDAEQLVFAPHLSSIVATSAACIGIMIGCGLLPVMVIPYDRPATVLRREGVGPSKAIRRLRVGLVVAQMTGCSMLVISTAVLVEGFRSTLETAIGHRLAHAILATVHADPDVGTRYFEDVEHAAKSMAGVSRTAWTSRLPGSQPIWESFRIEPREMPLRDVTLDTVRFTADSLKLFKLPPKSGRLFGFGDQACHVAVVNEEAAEKLFSGDTAGRIVQDSTGLPVQIVGVLAMRKAEGAPPTIYYHDSDQTGIPPHPTDGAHFRAPIGPDLARAELDTDVVSPSYFAAMGFSLTIGQGLDRPMPGECRIAVINQEAADIYFGGAAVGSAVIDDSGRRTAIIGVVHATALGTFQRRVEPAIYFPMSQDAPLTMTLIAGVRNGSGPMPANLESRIGSVPGRSPAPMAVKTLEAYFAQTSLAPLRIATIIISVSTTIALLISILGLFGALSDAARQRRRELAVRIALGAQRWRVIDEVLREGGRLAFAGTLAGMLGSLVLSRWLARVTLTRGLPALWIWLAAPLVLAVAVAIAGVLPARRASMVNPLAVLRDDN